MKARENLATILEAVATPQMYAAWRDAQQSARQHPRWQDIRHAVSAELVGRGAEEVGSSDINHGIMNFWQAYKGDWDRFLLDYKPRPEDALEF